VVGCVCNGFNNIAGNVCRCHHKTFKIDGYWDHAVKFARWQHPAIGHELFGKAVLLIAAQRVKSEKLDLICIPTSFQVSCHHTSAWAGWPADHVGTA